MHQQRTIQIQSFINTIHSLLSPRASSHRTRTTGPTPGPTTISEAAAGRQRPFPLPRLVQKTKKTPAAAAITTTQTTTDRWRQKKARGWRCYAGGLSQPPDLLCGGPGRLSMQARVARQEYYYPLTTHDDTVRCPPLPTITTDILLPRPTPLPQHAAIPLGVAPQTAQKNKNDKQEQRQAWGLVMTPRAYDKMTISNYTWRGKAFHPSPRRKHSNKVKGHMNKLQHRGRPLNRDRSIRPETAVM